MADRIDDEGKLDHMACCTEDMLTRNKDGHLYIYDCNQGDDRKASDKEHGW
jgi:hypothetical protein